MKYDYVCRQCGRNKPKDGGKYCKPCRAIGFDELLKLAKEIKAPNPKEKSTHDPEQ
ncbi:hypothetical protein [uncultured Victivallis sp.]|uniref:hypothetical protein n=1 Tax=uncultured Victivallis sp. TaxID=354118 RepID=UPI0025E082CD|nr:hypothetical protein [uncultured Victivallis sp.]